MTRGYIQIKGPSNAFSIKYVNPYYIVSIEYAPAQNTGYWPLPIDCLPAILNMFDGSTIYLGHDDLKKFIDD